MKPGDLILYTPDYDRNDSKDVGIVVRLWNRDEHASVLWSTETVPIFFSVGDLDRYRNNFKLVSS